MADWFWARIQRYLPWFLEVPPLSIGRIAAAQASPLAQLLAVALEHKVGLQVNTRGIGNDRQNNRWAIRGGESVANFSALRRRVPTRGPRPR